MRRNIYAAILLLTGAMMVACSGSDDLTENTTPEPQTPTGKGDVVLKGTLGSKGDVTRAINDYGYGTWEVGDKFAIYYTTDDGHSTAVATVNSINSNGSANFTATLSYPKTGSNDVTLVYPASAHNGQGGFKTDALMKQEGTMDYINTKGLDIETASTTMNVEGKTATLTSDVTMQPQVCLYKMTLHEDYYTLLNTTKLEITDDKGHSYTITPTGATSDFTIAMVPVIYANFTFTATTTEEYGIFTKQEGVTLTNCTADNVGDIFDKDGNIYKVSSAPGAIYNRTYNGRTLYAGKLYTSELYLNAVITASPGIAMIAYVGENGSVETGSNYRGLAISMRDSNKENTKNSSVNWWESTDFFTNYNPWSSVGNTGPCTNSVSDDITVARSLKNGIAMTDVLASDNHTTTTGHTHWPARVARNYNVTRPNDTSNWFLASLGQWQLILQGLITKQDNLTEFYSEEIPWDEYENPYMTYYHLDGILSKAGVSLGPCYWTSSEYDVSDVWTMGFADGAAFLTSKTNGSFHIHPFIAF